MKNPNMKKWFLRDIKCKLTTASQLFEIQKSLIYLGHGGDEKV